VDRHFGAILGDQDKLLKLHAMLLGNIGEAARSTEEITEIMVILERASSP